MDDTRFTDEEILNQIKAYRPVMNRVIDIYGGYNVPDFSYKGALYKGSRYKSNEGLLLRIKRGYFNDQKTLKEVVKKAFVEAANSDWYYKYEKEY